jgi:hypothetical protein
VKRETYIKPDPWAPPPTEVFFRSTIRSRPESATEPDKSPAHYKFSSICPTTALALFIKRAVTIVANFNYKTLNLSFSARRRKKRSRAPNRPRDYYAALIKFHSKMTSTSCNSCNYAEQRDGTRGRGRRLRRPSIKRPLRDST